MNRPELDRTRSGRGQGKQEMERSVIFTVSIAGERIGLPIECVRTVFRASAITAVPLAPARMIGLINLRGHVVTAICMRTCLGIDQPTLKNSLMVAVEHRGEGFALAVDNVGDVLEVSEEDRVPLPSTISAARRGLTSAVYRTTDDIVPVLNIEVLLGADQDAAAA